MKIGDKISWQRTFTEEDIKTFARLSGDQGEHHLIPDEQGRLMAHGLLTATLPTKPPTYALPPASHPTVPAGGVDGAKRPR